MPQYIQSVSTGFYGDCHREQGQLYIMRCKQSVDFIAPINPTYTNFQEE